MKVTFSADLQGANSNLGSGFLLASTTLPEILQEAAYLKAMGVQAVHVAVAFPTLTPAYYSNSSTAQQLTNFYGQVASALHRMGLKLIVETGPAVLNDSNGNIVSNSYLSSLSIADYQNGRAQTAVTIAQVMQPDYLTVLNEPDTEAMIAQKPALNTLSGGAALLATILKALQASGVRSLNVGAGIGSWLPNSSQWVTQIAATSGVNYVDIHLFPVTGNFLNNLFTLYQIAQSAGKPVAMSQVWLEKMALGEATGYGVLHARDAFSFWGPLDSQFLQSVAAFSRSTNTLFVSPFWARYFRAYLNYAQYASLTGSALEAQVAAATAAAGNAGLMDATGAAYAQALISPPDTVAPTIPANLNGFGANSNTVAVTWNASTDNIGVLGYQVYRDGTLLGTVAANTYLDSTATQAYHMYSVAAYDASGNNSGQSRSIQLAPIDITPPSTPSALTAVPASATQVNLSWPAATDNLAVAQYQVYRGSSASSLSLISVGIAAPNWSDTQVIPGKTFYYAVKALDAAHNSSGFSPIAAVTLPADTTPPSVPIGLAAQATSAAGVSLTWDASGENWYMGGYRIYRGTSPSFLVLIAGSSGTSYVDTTAKSNTKYYYSVAAFDAFGNISAQCVPVVVMTP